VNIFVGNLPYGVTDHDLRQAFEAHGAVSSASVILDKFTGKSRGFGFIEMPNQAEAQAAVGALNGKELQGRAMRVNEAQPREDRPPRRERSGGGGGGGGDWGGERRGGGGGGYGGGGGGGGGRRDRY
jgi:RNA recognition motif-containing protein